VCVCVCKLTQLKKDSSIIQTSRYEFSYIVTEVIGQFYFNMVQSLHSNHEPLLVHSRDIEGVSVAHEVTSPKSQPKLLDNNGLDTG